MGIRLDQNTSQLFLFGGHGGFGFSEHAEIEDNEVLVGLNVWSGVFIDAIQPLYSKVLPTGISSVVREGGKYGGRGGERTQLYMQNHVVTGISLRHGQVVDQLALIFRELTSEGLSPRSVASRSLGGAGGHPVNVATSEGEMAIGIFGASGWYVDRVSLITCGYQLAP